MRGVEIRRHGPVWELVLDACWAGRPIYPFRAYWVDGLLIDTGPPRRSRAVAALLRELPIRQVVNTHHHEDHAGNNALIQRELGLTPLAHPLAVPLLAKLPPIQLYRRAVWGAAENVQAEPLGEFIETPNYRFRVLHTPGHSPDHVALHEEQNGWLFSGDLYVADRLRLLRLEEDPFELMASLNTCLAHPFDTIFCAHAGRVRDAQTALTRKLAYMERLREDVRALHAQGLPEKEITQRVLGKENLMAFFSAGDFTRANLVRALLPGWPGPAPTPGLEPDTLLRRPGA